jgi:hypothetical protein
MEAQGLLAALFDFSFSEFITPKIIKWLYAFGIVVAAMGALFFIGAGFQRSGAAGLFFLIVSPVVFLLYALGVRIYLELVMVMFNIAGHVAAIAERDRQAP